MNYEVYADDDGEHRWRLKTSGGQVVAFSREAAFETASDAHAAAQEFKSLCKTLDPQAFVDVGDEFRWRLKSSTGETEAVSAENFKSREEAQRAAEDVRHNGGRANGP
jgi:uncharacterized protein YegP (UPF0339 family)